VIHILNGDATAQVFDAVDVEGQRLTWRDVLVEGPLGTEGTAEARARYLAARFGIDHDEYAHEFTEARRQVASVSRHDEVVLWFEQDLFCAVNLCFLLDRLASEPPARLSLVWLAEPLATLEADRLRHAYATRREADRAILAAASAAWRAFTSTDPRALQSARVDAVPFLGEALRRQLHRFPSVDNGLDEVETAALTALEDGPREFRDLFVQVTGTPTLRRQGMGDVQLAGDLGALASGDAALVAREETTWRLSDAGRAALAGRRDRVATLGIDRWLGGVHLFGRGPLWRWDAARGSLVWR
jgi:uncharacterized protein DUF1835